MKSKTCSRMRASSYSSILILTAGMVFAFFLIYIYHLIQHGWLSVFTEMETQPSLSFTICDSEVFHLHLLITLLQVISERDLLKKSLASHRATTKSEKRKSRAQEEGRGTGVKQSRIHFSGFGDVAVITANCRWTMKSTVVECSACSYWFEAKGDDYFASGFHPSSVIDEASFHLICTELLEWCWHFQYKMPGSSMNKVIETIQELSETHNRCTSLSNTEFIMAMGEYEFNRIRISQKILSGGCCDRGAQEERYFSLAPFRWY